MSAFDIPEAGVFAAARADGSCSVGAGAEQVTYPHCFSIATDSGLLAEFSGVLAGLTFTAVALLAGRFAGRDEPSDGRRRASIEDTLILFLGAFVSFAIATYLFTAAASEVRPGARGAFVAFCASLALCTALHQLFVGLVRLVDHLGFVRAARFTAAIYSHGVLPVVFVYMSLTAVDSSGMHLSESEAWSTPLAYGCIALCAFVVLWTLRPAPGRASAASSADNASSAVESSVVLPAAVSSLSAVVAAITAAVWAEQDYTAAVGDEVYMAFIGVLFGVTLLHHHRVQGYFNATALLAEWFRQRVRRDAANPLSPRRTAEPAPDGGNTE